MRFTLPAARSSTISTGVSDLDQWAPFRHLLPRLSPLCFSLCPAAGEGRHPDLSKHRSSPQRGVPLTCPGGIISEPIPPLAQPDRSIFPGAPLGGGCGGPLPGPSGGAGSLGGPTPRLERSPCAGPARAFYWPLCMACVTSPIGERSYIARPLSWNVSAACTLPSRGAGGSGMARGGRTDPRCDSRPFVE